jgi:hypothetical protein
MDNSDKQVIKTIGKIADRVITVNPNYDRTTVMMDLMVLYETGVKMRWDELLNAPLFDFMHDINGINQNLNRYTYKLENCFYPRYAK